MRYGYARVSEDLRDEVDQRSELHVLGVDDYLADAGLVGPNLTRQALTELLARCRPGDEIVVTRLSRLARSLPDLREILLALTAAGVDLRVGPTLYGLGTADQTLSDVVSLMAGFEGELASHRAEAGWKAARAQGRRPGRRPKLDPAQEQMILDLYRQGVRTADELAESYGVSRSTIYRLLERSEVAPMLPGQASTGERSDHASR